MTKGLMSLFSTLQYSITPVLQGRDFKELLATFILPYLPVVILKLCDTPKHYYEQRI